MKAVLMSIRPKWCELIASGRKTVEVRKTRPKLKAPFKVYIYCTKDFKPNTPYSFKTWAGRGKVMGEFVCDAFVVDKTFGHDALFNAAACMGDAEVSAYCLNAEMYGWHISDLKIYDKPKPLWDFMKCGAPTENELDEELCSYCEQTEWGERKCYGTPDGPIMCEGAFCGEAYDLYLDEHFVLKRPPQSWCYVEELP